MEARKASRALATALVISGLMASTDAQAQAPAQAQGTSAAAQQASVTTIKVHSRALEGNLEGNAADRDVIVVLPPSYAANPGKRYPVIYFLHGYMATAKAYDDLVKYGEAMSEQAAKGHEFILVAPDSMTKFGGAMYSDSVTAGNFEGFIARDLVAHIDRSYRTIAKPDARGLAGHSMGGYGTLKIAMKYPGIFSSIYAMSSCCLSARQVNPAQDKRLETITVEQAMKADFSTKSTFAAASAWSADPSAAPFFFRLGTRNGEIQRDVLAQWAANAPNAMLPQYAGALKRLKAMALDVGDKDFLLQDNKAMKALLDKFGIRHAWTIYDGDHGNRVASRFRAFVLPFFATHLATK